MPIEAAQEVQEKVNGVLADLPKDVDPPSVLRFDPDAQPVLFLALNARGRDQKEITDIADRVVRRLDELTAADLAVLSGAAGDGTHVL